MPGRTLDELRQDLVFDETAFAEAAKAAVALKGPTQALADELYDSGIRTLLFVGAGGTYIMAHWLEELARQRSNLSVHALVAAELLAVGHPQLGKDAAIVVTSQTGNTAEVIDAIEFARAAGATVVSFVPFPDTPIAQQADHYIQSVENWRGWDIYHLVLVARFLERQGQFPEYPRLYAELDAVPAAMVDAVKTVEPKAALFAEAHAESDYFFLIASGWLWGLTYSYSMCVLEEGFWVRTTRVTGPEFFHGSLELIERSTPVLIMQGEDYGRELTERAIRFSREYCDDVNVFDTADLALAGISPEIRPLLGNLIQNHVFKRITLNLQVARDHDSSQRHYYRKVAY